MPPAAALTVFRLGVLSVEDQQIDAAHKLNQCGGSFGKILERFVIGQISNRIAVRVDAKSGASTGMIQIGNSYSECAERDIVGTKLFDTLQASQEFETDREMDRVHLVM